MGIDTDNNQLKRSREQAAVVDAAATMLGGNGNNSDDNDKNDDNNDGNSNGDSGYDDDDNDHGGNNRDDSNGGGHRQQSTKNGSNRNGLGWGACKRGQGGGEEELPPWLLCYRNAERCKEKVEGKKVGVVCKILVPVSTCNPTGAFWGQNLGLPRKSPQTLPRQKWGESGACLSVAL